MKLVKYFKEMCVNQAEFSKKIGVTPVTIANILAGKYDIRLTTALRIEDATDGKVTCRDLINHNSMKLMENRSKFLSKE